MRSLLIALSISLCVAGACGQSLDFAGTPVPGAAVSFVMSGEPGASFLLAASTNPGPTVFPVFGSFDLAPPFVLLNAQIPGFPFQPALGPNGLATVSLAIPNSASFIGTSVYAQGIYADPASPIGFTKTTSSSFTVLDPAVVPTIAAITPNQGGVSGGTPVTITGTNFEVGGTGVLVGGQPLSNLQVVDSMTVTGETPAGSAGSVVDLQVTTNLGVSASLPQAYSYVAVAPTVTAVTPDRAQSGGGIIVTVSGTGLDVGTTIYIASWPLTPIVQTDTQVVAIAPPFTGTGFVDVVASSPEGFDIMPGGFRFTVPMDTGDGSDGPFTPTVNTVLDTTPNLGVFNFTNINIPAGVTVTATGPHALHLKCTGEVVIDGELRVDGEDGTTGGAGAGGPGGFDGGAPGGSPPGMTLPQFGFGPGGGSRGSGGTSSSALRGRGASYGTLGCGGGISGPADAPYGDPQLINLVGGSGGGGGHESALAMPGGGGGGGGAIGITALGDIVVDGLLSAAGGYGGPQSPLAVSGGPGGAGSGGAVRLRAQGSIVVNGHCSVEGGSPNSGAFCGGNGRWLVENWLGQVVHDVTATIPQGLY